MIPLIVLITCVSFWANYIFLIFKDLIKFKFKYFNILREGIGIHQKNINKIVMIVEIGWLENFIFTLITLIKNIKNWTITINLIAIIILLSI